jgi:predicted transcriptional regulator
MTQQELAYRAGLSISIVAHLEQGAKIDPRLSTLSALAEALQVDPGELIGPRSSKRRRKR